MKNIVLIGLITTTIFFTGCASTGPTSRADPFEPFNRATYQFNEVVDNALLTPIAKGYTAITPGIVRTGVSNVFTNIGDVATAVNNLLQGKVTHALSDTGRFIVNSTLGILGLLDVATPMGLEKHDEDFGQTLGKWGINSGPYLVIPFMGPSTLRDGVGRVADSKLGWSQYVDHVPTRNSVYALEVIDLRANLLGASKTLDEAALDKYQFLRDAYLQRRLNQVYDGKIPDAKRDQLEADLEPIVESAPPK